MSYTSRTLPVYFGPRKSKLVPLSTSVISFTWRRQRDALWLENYFSFTLLYSAYFHKLLASLLSQLDRSINLSLRHEYIVADAPIECFETIFEGKTERAHELHKRRNGRPRMNAVCCWTRIKGYF